MTSIAQQLRVRRLEQAQELAQMLYCAGAKRVWLFGSLARGAPSDRRTDIDLAVEGIPADRCAALARRLRDVVRAKVDLVRIEDAGPALRRSIADGSQLRQTEPDRGASRTSLSFAAPPVPSSARLRPVGLHQQRIQAVVDVIGASGCTSVLDLGCGEGRLVARLVEDRRIDRVLGVDISAQALAAASRRLGLPWGNDVSGSDQRVRLLRALATNADSRFAGYDVVVSMEMLEHLDPPRLSAFRRVVLSFLRPMLLIVTTPNADYNVHLGMISPAGRRIQDHRFEWTRDGFRAWMTRAAGEAGYACELRGVGAAHPSGGPPTQMAICRRLAPGLLPLTP